MKPQADFTKASSHPPLKRIGLTVDSLKLNFDSRKRNIIQEYQIKQLNVCQYKSYNLL